MDKLFSIDEAKKHVPDDPVLRDKFELAFEYDYIFNILKEDEGLNPWDFDDYKYTGDII